MSKIDSFVLAAGIAAITLLTAPVATNAAEPSLCGPVDFEAARYTVCTADPAALEIDLFWRNADKEPYRHFGALASAVEAEGRTLRFAMNAGMYDTDFRPIGLFVSGGEQLISANTRDVQKTPVPNFYKKPNGVFYVTEAGAGIATTEDYVAAPPAARIATQSGPLLVIAGELHPALIPGSTDRTRRSGVGVCEGGVVKFALSDGSVNFHDFARLFRDHLGCQNALFLDGGRGVGLYDPVLHRNDISWHGGYGPMLAVTGAAAD